MSPMSHGQGCDLDGVRGRGPLDTRVIADRVNPKRFYGIALFEGKLFESVDGAAHFTERPLVLSDGLPKRGGNGADNRSDRGDDRGGQDRIYATPEREGDLWLAAYNGLYHSKAKGFDRMPGVKRSTPSASARRPQGQGCSPLSGGTVQGQRGFFRSTDSGATWVRINDDQHQWGLVLHITGDPKSSAASTWVPTDGVRSTEIRPASSCRLRNC